MTIPSQVPDELRAGVQWDWTRDASLDYPADGGWSLKYWFKKTGASGANFSVDAVQDPSYTKQFKVSILASVTDAYTAGDYTWVAIVTKGTELHEIDEGRLSILPRYDQAANLDDRTHARKVLEAIEAVLESRASQTQRELVAFTIGSRSQTFDNTESKEKLLEFRSRYKWLVFDEENAAKVAQGQPNARLVRVRFQAP